MMQPLTGQQLAGNAYRILGLSGDATQAQIDAAARRMRLWSDPADIPPTPWDFPQLGPVPRAPLHIEHAVAALHDPVARLQERALWFRGEAPMGDGAWAWNGAMEGFHAVVRAEPLNIYHWTEAFTRLEAAATSAEAHGWFCEVERCGEFEKVAAIAEIDAALQELPARAALTLAARVRALLYDGTYGLLRVEQVLHVAAFLSRAAIPDARRIAPSLLDDVEDVFIGHAEEVDGLLRENLRENRQYPHVLFSRNTDVTMQAAARFDGVVEPLMQKLLQASAGDAEREDRVRQVGAQLLAMVALGWELSGSYVVAEQALQRGLSLSAEGTASYGLRNALERVGPLAERARAEARRAREQREANDAFVRRMERAGGDAAGGGAAHPRRERMASTVRTIGMLVAALVIITTLLGVPTVALMSMHDKEAPRPLRGVPQAPRPRKVVRDPYSELLKVTPSAAGENEARFAERAREP
jgi:hypothetical protein